MTASFHHQYRASLARVTASLGVPFGYTLTVWASGALAMHYFGVPAPAEIVAFVGGAVATYVVLGAVEYPELHVVEPLRTRRIVMFNAVPVLAAAVVAAVDRAVAHPFWGWLLSGAAATGVYVALLALCWAWDARARHEVPPS